MDDELNHVPETPLGSTPIELRADEVDYLVRYWELKDHSEIFTWGAKMLYDLSKLDEAGWRLTLAKAEVNEETKTVVYDPSYRQFVMLMKWLGPAVDGWNRLPKAETLERLAKVELTAP